MERKKLADLLRYKKKVTIEIRGKKLGVRWVRVIGDTDLSEAYRKARIASAKKRKELRDLNSDFYKDELSLIEDTTAEDCIQVILAARENDFRAQAFANVERPNLPALDEVAVDADAPTLEEQEKLDEAIFKTEQDYEKSLEDYVQARITETRTTLESTTLETLRELTKEETINVLALTEFLQQVQDEKIWRAVFYDEECKEREFDSLEEFKDVNSQIKDILYQAYSELELGGEEIKN